MAVTTIPTLIAQGVNGFRLYSYQSTDATGTVDASAYFTNGYAGGMRSGDLVIVTDTDATPVANTSHTVNVSGTTIDLSNGVDIGSTNGD